LKLPRFPQLVLCFLILLTAPAYCQNKKCSAAELQAKIDVDGSRVGGHFGAAALLIESGERISMHGAERFPMQSVYKLYIAMAVLQQVDQGHLSLEQTIRIEKSDYSSLHSTIREKYPEGGVDLTIRELLTASVVDSDNVASDALLSRVGPKEVTTFLRRLGVIGINVADTEKEMSHDWGLQYRNWATPDAAVEILRLLAGSTVLSRSSQALLLGWMENSVPGEKRLKGLLPPGTTVAHKTGTSGTQHGLTAATNDAGIITLPNGNHVAIAVFVSDSHADQATREAVIAKTARTVWNCWSSTVQ
jgi:beta-lactamase class A